ncbi:YopX family protein [Terrisporobacter sp.]|uniref:YopX family protein n=1 Tax=Terrisporobacter sp. TaxID=1965305 RepID=UPI0028A259DB|nr:YopX family protein [Terrisporobacter sp.]
MIYVEFRGKKIDNDKWVYGYYNWCNLSGEHIIAINNDYDEDRVYYSFEKEAIFEKVVPKTVGQYTTLKDKNGIKIYVGDILKGKGRMGVVKFKYGMFVIDYGEEHIGDVPIYCLSDYYEKIGNIHDNPELII